LHKEDLDNKKPNKMINQFIAHKYSIGMDKQESTSTSSKKSLAAKHTCKHQPRQQEQSSSEEEEEEEEDESDDEESSSENEATSGDACYRHDKVAKQVRKIYMLGYETP